MFNKIVTSEELASIPIRVLYLSKATKFDHHPQLLLIFCDGWTQQLLESLHNFLIDSRFKASLKIIVFYEHLYVKQLVLIQTAFTYSNLFNVIFIRTDRLQVHYYLVYKKRFVSLNGVVSYAELFPDQTMDLAGREMYLSISRNDPDQLVSTPQRLFKGRVYEWAMNTVEHYNGTGVVHRLAPEHNFAYEVKIITFMINAPYASNPRTFEDLLEGGITINMSTRTSIELLGDPKFEQVFKYSPGIPAMRYHPKAGYCARSNDIRLGIVDPVNYDLRTKRSKTYESSEGQISAHGVGILRGWVDGLLDEKDISGVFWD
ncbi:hypothetical protein pipiens_013700 [Culex pipiens pipiens]|uniref:Ionotropic receptor n=1 Tax=Culex pipiens pipiens TaxID=38569 RepID=A0ABD1CXF0_CULPP